MKQGHCATTKMGVINEEIFPFFGGEIGLFQLNNCRVVNDFLVKVVVVGLLSMVVVYS